MQDFDQYWIIFPLCYHYYYFIKGLEYLLNHCRHFTNIPPKFLTHPTHLLKQVVNHNVKNYMAKLLGCSQ